MLHKNDKILNKNYSSFKLKFRNNYQRDKRFVFVSESEPHDRHVQFVDSGNLEKKKNIYIKLKKGEETSFDVQ
jgi:uncharacterized membrane protein